MASFYSVSNLSNLTTINDMDEGAVANISGFWNTLDGGGGTFVYDSSETINPLTIGYDSNFDGMVVKPSNGIGRWVRQWDRGKLNIRWFGAKPNNGNDSSIAINVSISYAQFLAKDSSSSEATLFNNKTYTSPGKTIFFPTGRYYCKSPILDITYGLVLEGEGSNGSTSTVGTNLLVLYANSDDEHGFIRYVSNGSFNTGGGIRNLTIDIFSPAFNANIVTLFSRDLSDVSFWTAENVILNCANKAKRCLFARSFIETGSSSNRWNVRDINLINCYFSGATQQKSTIVLSNVANCYLLGGFIYSGDAGSVISGVWITGNHGCTNLVISGSTIEIIKIVKASDSLINCRATIEAAGATLDNVVKSMTTTSL